MTALLSKRRIVTLGVLVTLITFGLVIGCSNPVTDSSATRTSTSVDDCCKSENDVTKEKISNFVQNSQNLKDRDFFEQLSMLANDLGRSDEITKPPLTTKIWTLNISSEEFESKYRVDFDRAVDRLYRENNGFADLGTFERFLRDNYSHILTEYKGDIDIAKTRAPDVTYKNCCSTGRSCSTPCRCPKQNMDGSTFFCQTTVLSSGAITDKDFD